jgi:hypothetical protein
LADGIPKQSDDRLEDIRDWIDALLAYREDISPEDIEASDGEAIESVEDADGGSVVIKKVSCGKNNCKCQRGDLHGPYRYVVRRHGDSLQWEYKGAVSG